MQQDNNSVCIGSGKKIKPELPYKGDNHSIASANWNNIIMKVAHILAGLISVSLAACVSAPMQLPQGDEMLAAVQPFSTFVPGSAKQMAWRPFILSHLKRSTYYQAVIQDGGIVMKAVADSSASGLTQRLNLSLPETPYLTWRWNVSHILKEADNVHGPDDSPARVVVTFEGDKSRWDFEDSAFAERIKEMTGNDIPYATLMYIWSNRDPQGTVIANRHTSRIKMVVAESGAEKLGTWVDEKWNLYEDFKRAFGEEPGKVLSIGIMSDTDNTAQRVTTYYGDIAFTRLAN